jgi:microcystin-dependent protein
MPIPQVPPFLPDVLGTAADVRDILATTPAGSGQVSYQSGFPAITAVPLTAGGIAPQREDFNAINKLLTQHIFYQQSGGRYPWQSSLNYIVGCFVLGSNGITYEAKKSSGPDVPEVGAKDPTLAANTAYWRDTTIAPGTPVGAVIAFSGTFGGDDNRYPIPPNETTPNTNWVLCDGIETNGITVPDLRGRMIIGTNSDYPRQSIGGGTTHGHGFHVWVNDTTLSVNQMPSHFHTQSTQGENRIGSTANIQQCWQVDACQGYWGSSTYYTGGSQSHGHGSGGYVDSTNHMPPYYSLAYIMQIGG